VAEIDEDAWISGERNVAQDLGELACGELARSTGAADEFGQAFLAKHAHGVSGVNGGAIVPKVAHNRSVAADGIPYRKLRAADRPEGSLPVAAVATQGVGLTCS
jgi:microcystin-dependent protein